MKNTLLGAKRGHIIVGSKFENFLGKKILQI